MESGTRIITGPALARDVSFETFMADYAHLHAEWVDGAAIKMPPISRDHDLITGFLYRLLSEYLDETGEALLMKEPFVMRIGSESPARKPDLHLVLRDRSSIVSPAMTNGPADIVVEVVSLESAARDRGGKFVEYQSGGVREYWLIDPLAGEANFYAPGEDSLYHPVELSGTHFRSTVLPRFHFDTQLLWQDALPTGKKIRALVDAMLA